MSNFFSVKYYYSHALYQMSEIIINRFSKTYLSSAGPYSPIFVQSACQYSNMFWMESCPIFTMYTPALKKYHRLRTDTAIKLEIERSMAVCPYDTLSSTSADMCIIEGGSSCITKFNIQWKAVGNMRLLINQNLQSSEVSSVVRHILQALQYNLPRLSGWQRVILETKEAIAQN